MATQKQIEANRKNAKKSTGPQSADGKAIVAQNALKHGLTALKPLIPGEDPDQFAIFNDAMLAELTPQGPLETVIANRIITLTWQLNRAPRIQAAAFNFMMEDLFRTPSDPEEHIGKTIARDFENNHVLEKLQAYEQRIESNIYKTIAQLEKIQIKRKESQPQNQPNLYAHGVPCPDQSTSYEPPTTNSPPQNKPNPEIETPHRMSSRAKECEAKCSVPQPRDLFKQHREAIPINKNPQKTTNSSCKNKPNSNILPK